MKVILIVAGLYSLVVAVAEFSWVSTGNTTLASIAALPATSSLVDPLISNSDGSSVNGANLIEGGLDAAVGLGLIYWGWKA
jgi:hypothetical protein